MCIVCDRRSLFHGAAGAGLLAMAGRTAVAQPSAAPVAGLPVRGEYLIKGAILISMDPAVGDVPDGAVHVRDGAIVQAGRDVAAPAAEVIAADGAIIMPGLVETHWHMWNSLLRSMATDTRRYGYFPTSAQLGAFYTPGDIYCGVRLATAEGINAGITCIHDWAHNLRSPAHADENVRALREAGIRGRFSYGPARGIPVSQALDIADLRRMHRDWSRLAPDGLLQLGLAWRGVQYAVTAENGAMAFQAVPREVYQAEYDTARDLGIPVTLHANIGPKVDYGHVAKLDQLGLLYPGLQLIHMIASTPAEIDAVAKAGCSVSFSPYTEMRTGFGIPQPSLYLDKGVRVGLSVDTTTLSGDANMFEIMKGIQNGENGLALSEFKMPARRVVEMGTIGGARSIGLDAVTGSITPGKRADLIVIDTGAVNLGMMTDPYEMIVGAAQPANVSTVLVDGRILKRDGKLTAMDARRIVADASAANVAVRKRAGWW